MFENQLRDDSMKSLGEYIQSSSTIEVITLGSNDITDEGIELLSSYFTNQESLRKLSLGGNSEITMKSVPLLIKMIENSRLEDINIVSTKIIGSNPLTRYLVRNRLKYKSSKLELVGR